MFAHYDKMFVLTFVVIGSAYTLLSSVLIASPASHSPLNICSSFAFPGSGQVWTLEYLILIRKQFIYGIMFGSVNGLHLHLCI